MRRISIVNIDKRTKHHQYLPLLGNSNSSHGRQYQQQQPKQQRYNNNAIIELDLDDDAPDEVEIIPNTQIHTDNDSLDREDVTVDEQMETVEEEEEEEERKEKEDVPERRSRRKHVILTSSEEQTQGTQNDNNNNNNRISGGDTPTTATTTATTTNTNRDLYMQSEEFRDRHRGSKERHQRSLVLHLLYQTSPQR